MDDYKDFDFTDTNEVYDDVYDEDGFLVAQSYVLYRTLSELRYVARTYVDAHIIDILMDCFDEFYKPSNLIKAYNIFKTFYAEDTSKIKREQLLKYKKMVDIHYSRVMRSEYNDEEEMF